MVTGIKDWSTTPGDNNSPPPNGAPEGMPPSSVNDIIRQNMAEIRAWYEDPLWIDYGHTLTYIDADTFRVAGDKTALYAVGRRVRATGTTPFTIYGTIASSAYSAPNTDVNMVWDSGSLDATLSMVALSSVSTTGKPITSDAISFADESIPMEAVDGLEETIEELEELVAGALPPGFILPYAGATPPSGWLVCDGSVKTITDYQKLYDEIGTTYNTGGESGTQFRVPELRGEFIRGLDASRGVDSGRALGSPQADEFKTHSHGGVPNPGSTSVGSGGATERYVIGTKSTDAAGGTETRPRNVAFPYLIKT